MGHIIITNVVSSANLCVNIDLHKVTYLFGSIIKNNKMQNVIWRHKKIKGTALLFSNGYISVHGNNSIQSAKKSLRQFARLLWTRGYSPNFKHIKINTISVCYKLGHKVDLTQLSFHSNFSYEPELFSAAIISFGKLRFLLYCSGTIVITGIKPGKVGFLRKALRKICHKVNQVMSSRMIESIDLVV